MLDVAQHWYRSSLTWLTFLLLPLSWLFRLLVAVRRFLYRIHLKKKYHFSVPVIVVGNITVGGTGKTPLVIWLIDYLRAKGFKPGIVSRGVGGKMQRLPRWVNHCSNPVDVGDEAVLLARRCDCPVVIGIDRVAAVKTLLAETQCNIVVSDDGLQHYRLGRDVEIAMIDGERELGNQQFLPAGPLRESIKRLKQVDFVVKQGGEKTIDTFLMTLCGKQVFLIQDEKQKKSLADFNNKTVHAVAGIGNPQRFFALLRARGLTIIEHIFPDHYLYQASDIDFEDALPVLMTEKDAVKCQKFVDHRHWCLPVVAEVDIALVEKLNAYF